MPSNTLSFCFIDVTDSKLLLNHTFGSLSSNLIVTCHFSEEVGVGDGETAGLCQCGLGHS
jgi:hypothetical protein